MDGTTATTMTTARARTLVCFIMIDFFVTLKVGGDVTTATPRWQMARTDGENQSLPPCCVSLPAPRPHRLASASRHLGIRRRPAIKKKKKKSSSNGCNDSSKIRKKNGNTNLREASKTNPETEGKSR